MNHRTEVFRLNAFLTWEINISPGLDNIPQEDEFPFLTVNTKSAVE